MGFPNLQVSAFSFSFIGFPKMTVLLDAPSKERPCGNVEVSQQALLLLRGCSSQKLY